MRLPVFEGTTRESPNRSSATCAELWSRRLFQKDRLIYLFDGQSIYIFAIDGHDDQHRCAGSARQVRHAPNLAIWAIVESPWLLVL